MAVEVTGSATTLQVCRGLGLGWYQGPIGLILRACQGAHLQ
jgi:hypothetical protein